jgi:2-polyprenyl-3-methyl-5-hydroxy-6-metoxy-1,4-benzoquinol methylase
VRQVSVQADDWDRHWTDFADRVTQNPAQAMRRRVIHSLLHVGDGPARVLDIGCGQGDLVAEMSARYPHAELHGIDYSRYGVQVAGEKVPRATFTRRDLLTSGHPPADRVAWATHAICSEVLEHVDEPESLLRNARGYLAPGCRLVVTVPGGPMSAFDRHIGHRRHFSAGALRQVLAASGFAVEKVTGVGFPLFNLYRLVVISRGQRLVGDLAAGGAGRKWALSPARLAMGGFGLLLAAPQPQSRWGWQVVAVARVQS